MNRDWSNVVQQGLLEGMLKYIDGGRPDCTTEGLTMLRGFIALLKRFFHFGVQGEIDIINAGQLFFLFEGKCNYMATLEGVAVTRTIATWYDNPQNILDQIQYAMWEFFEQTSNIFDDCITLMQAGLGFMAHTDPHNLSVALGKIIKIIYMLYMDGLFVTGFVDDFFDV